MAGIDKTYVSNKDDYEALMNWVNSQDVYTIPTTGESFHIKDYMYNWSEEDVLRALDAGNEVPIWNTPMAVDKYLYNNCPLKFVQDRLNEQYGHPDAYLSEYSEYEYGECSVLKFDKIPKFSRIEFEVMDKDGVCLTHSESTDMWISIGDALSMHIVDTNGLSMRKLRRLLKKWMIPVGFAVYMRVYTGYEVTPLMRVTSFSK